MSVDNKQNFMDPKTIVAIILVGVCWFGWQSYMQKKYPQMYDKSAATQPLSTDSKAAAPNAAAGETSAAKNNVSDSSVNVANEVQSKEEITNFSDANWSFDVSSFGMGLKNITLKKYTRRDGSPITIGKYDFELPFSTNVIGKNVPLWFNVKRVSENEFVGNAAYGQVHIEKRLVIDSNLNTVAMKIFVSGVANEDKFSGVINYLSEGLTEPDRSIPLLPHFERQEVFVMHDNSQDRVAYTDTDQTKSFDKVTLVSIGGQYFAQAIVDKSDILPEVKAIIDHGKKSATVILRHNIIDRKSDMHIEYLGFAGPKSLQQLASIDENLTKVINYGWFSGLAKVILTLLKFFHGYLGNWGLSIIILTILVRFVVLPFNLMSFKSMKKMQVIQPKITALREKYKSDPQKLNQETMVLFKENQVNPMGGCLPMLLQFPVFISLYQTLGQSIELYQAPFIFWIKDLSVKDPFYVLPVLMGLTMFAQQKMTPSSMDPVQQKIFMFMPIVFSVMMVTLPSGLTLYIFVSALFAVLQQLYFMKDKNTQPQIIS